MNLWDVVGAMGGLILSYSNLPQLLLFFRQKHAKGISVSSTWLGTMGLLFRALYVCHTAGYNWIVLGPYLFSAVCCIITLLYCYFPYDNDDLTPSEIED